MIRFAAALSVSALLPAAELVVRDVGGGLAWQPTSFTYALADDTGRRTGSDAFDRRYGIELSGLYSFAGTGDSTGMVAGGGLGAGRADYTGGGLTEYGLHARVGYAWAATDRLSLLGDARLGLGYGSLTIDGGSSFPSYTATGPQIGLGAGVGAAFAVTEKVVVRLDAGYRRDQFRMSGGGKTLDLTASGPAVSVTIAWRTSATPFLLE